MGGVNGVMPLHICIGGPTGAGKTTLAYLLRRAVPSLAAALVLDNDQVRRELRGYDIRSIMKEEDYTPEVTAQVRARMDAMTREALAQGRPVIDSTGFWEQPARDHIEKLSRACGARFIGLWLHVPDKVLRARVQRRLDERRELQELSGERGHASDACLGVLEKYAPLMPENTPAGWFAIDAAGPENEVVNKVIPLI